MDMRLSDGESDQGFNNLFIAVVGVGLSGEGGRQQWCEFNASVSA
jgi:hypothetical protein